MCRNLLTRYGVEAFPPRNQIDDFKNTLYPHVTVERLSASVSITDLYHSTLCNIVSSESLQSKLNDIANHANLVFMVKAGLDGSGSHKKRHQLSGDQLDDTMSGSSENFLGVFMTPMSILCNVGDASVVLWKNPLPNSIFYTRPIQLFKAKETRSFIEQIFPNLQSSMDSLEIPHQIEGLSHKCSITTKVTMIDGKMTDILQGDSGAFCHYCDIKRDAASDPLVLFEYGAGGMHITKTIEECYRRWSLVQSGDIGYNNPLRAGQCHKPLMSKSGRFFAVLHQELRSLDFCLKILYHLVAGQKIWSETDSSVKAEVASAKARVISHVRASCGGLLLDSPTTCGGNTNAGPVAKRFFGFENRVAISSLIEDAEDRENFSILLGMLNVCLSVVESVDVGKKVFVDRFKNHCYETMVHIVVHFPWVFITPSVHQMLAHSWQLFEMQDGGPIAIWSESGVEAWNKHVRNFRSGAGCRARQTSVQANINDIFVRMLITSAPIIAKIRQDLMTQRRQSSSVACMSNEEESLIQLMYE